MSGHSKWSTIKRQKGANDARRGALFTKVAREISVAARQGGGDPEANYRLRLAIEKARSVNMPADNIKRTIDKATGGGEGEQYEEIVYEGYGPGGIAIIVEALTDNRNRTASEVRSAFSKHGGTLGETNSVSFMFERKGVVRYPAKAASAEAMFEAALDAGAGNVESDPDSHEVTCATEDFAAVRDALERRFGAPQEARLQWRPLNSITVDADTAGSLLKLLDVLEDNDDVQTVSANFDIAEDVMARLTA